MRSVTRMRALIGAVVAVAVAAIGIALPGGGDDATTTAPPAALEPTPGLSAPQGEGEGEGGEQEETGEPVELPADDGIPSDQRAAIGEVLALIVSGAPLPYSQDGGTFQNREGLLPDEPLGYYKEYTVDTPGSPDRGARRLVIGAGGEVYYTDDHYSSFTRIDPEDYL